MDGSKIEDLLARSALFSSLAHSQTLEAVSFCVPGMKNADEIRSFLGAIRNAKVYLDSAADYLESIQRMYR